MCSSCRVNNVDLIGGGDRQSHRLFREQGQIEMPKITAFSSMKMLVATAAAMVGLIAQPLVAATDSAYAGDNARADPAAIEEGHSLQPDLRPLPWTKCGHRPVRARSQASACAIW